jgi:hypothetical protein
VASRQSGPGCQASDRRQQARAGRILVRTDGAGFSHDFLDHLANQPDGRSLEYSVGYAVTDDVRAAITLLPEWAWTSAIDADGGHRDGAEVAEITDILCEVRHLAATRRRRERAKKAQASGQKVHAEATTKENKTAWPDAMRSWSAARDLTPALSWTCSRNATAGATKRWPPRSTNPIFTGLREASGLGKNFREAIGYHQRGAQKPLL